MNGLIQFMKNYVALSLFSQYYEKAYTYYYHRSICMFMMTLVKTKTLCKNITFTKK